MPIIQEAMQRRSLEDMAASEGRLEEHTDASRSNAYAKKQIYHVNMDDRNIQRKIRTLGASLLAISSLMGYAILGNINKEKKLIVIEEPGTEEPQIEAPSFETEITYPEIQVVPYIINGAETPEYRLI